MPSRKSATPTPTTSSASNQQLPTFLDHVHELRRRLFWVVATVIVAASVAYGFLNDIINVLTYPLGDQRLFYLTPAGGLTFTFKLCTYAGIMFAVPVIMYHLYRFLEPLMVSWRKSAFFYVGLSSVFAIGGALFGYFVTLPAALHFLTNFNLNHIQAMLTVDSYLSFVLTYLLISALLFQIPLLLLIINSMTPLKPSKLMKFERYVIVGAFLAAAIFSPTPDIMNQTFLALPIVVMYQIGVIMVWLQHKYVARKQAKMTRRQMLAQVSQPLPQTSAPQPMTNFVAANADSGIPADILAELQQAAAPPPIRPQTMQKARPASRPVMPVQPAPKAAPAQPIRTRPTAVISDIGPRRPGNLNRPPVRPTTPRQPAPPVVPREPQLLRVPARSVDGFLYRPSLPASSS